jgi:hypothetical protein
MLGSTPSPTLNAGTSRHSASVRDFAAIRRCRLPSDRRRTKGTDMTLVAVHHLGSTVTDVERSARWYEDVLGFFEVGLARRRG